MQATQPVPQPSSVTPIADTTPGAVGVGLPYARSDHAHPLSSIYQAAAANFVTFQNAADNGLKLQHVTTGSITTASASGSVFFGSSGSVAFPATFSATPFVSFGCNDTNGPVWAGGYTALSTSAITVRLVGVAVNATGTITVVGVG